MSRKRVPSRLNLLTVRQVQTAGEGDHADGGGLLLRVRGASATWVFRYTSPSTGKRREMGLGVADRGSLASAGKSLTSARSRAHVARAQLLEDLDPIEARAARRLEQREAAAAAQHDRQREQRTLARVARDYHARIIEPARTAKHAAQWLASLENHVPSALWHKPIARIEAPELLDAMTELYGRVPETAQRVRQQLEVIFEDAVFRRLCGTNPAAAIKRKMREAARRRDRGAFRALPFAQMPAFMTRLRGTPGIAARALEYTILTAARTAEALGLPWDEVDLDAGMVTIGGARMKGGETHGLSILGWIARDIDFKNSCTKGYWVGFFSYLERLIHAQASQMDVFSDVDRLMAYYVEMRAKRALEAQRPKRSDP